MPALIIIAYGSLLVLSLLDNIRAPFYPEILTDMHLNGTRGALFYSMTSLFAFLASWWSHSLIHRFSALVLLRAACVLVAVGFAAISQVHSFEWMLVGCSIFGIGYGVLNLAQNVMVVEASTPVMRRRIFSGLHAMYGFAALMAPIAASAFRWLGWSWRDGFLLLSVLALLWPCLSWKVRKPLPDQSSSVVGPKRMNGKEWRRCILVALMLAGYLWGEIGASTRMVLWLRADKGFSPDRANLYLSGFFIALLAGRIFFGVKHFPGWDNWRILKWSAATSALMFLLGLHADPVWFIACGLCLSPFFPVTMEQVSILFGEKSSHALGFVIGFGSLSVVLLHIVLGSITDAVSVSSALNVGLTTLVMISLGLWTREQMAVRSPR